MKLRHAGVLGGALGLLTTQQLRFQRREGEQRQRSEPFEVLRPLPALLLPCGRCRTSVEATDTAWRPRIGVSPVIPTYNISLPETTSSPTTGRLKSPSLTLVRRLRVQL